MQNPSSSLRDLARRLLADSQTASNPHVDEAAVVIEKLRSSLARFAGAQGFASLLRRALTLASAEVPSLRGVKIGSDGRLEGLGQPAAETGTVAQSEEEVVAVTAYLLGLLVTFIGKPLTLRLVREAWPDTPLDEYSVGSEAER